MFLAGFFRATALQVGQAVGVGVRDRVRGVCTTRLFFHNPFS